MVKILIADNHLLTREGIRSLIAEYKIFRIVGEALDSKELETQLKSLNPNVVIIDYHLPGFFSIEDIKKIYNKSPKTNVLVVTTNQYSQDILKALDYGVNNYIFKLCDKEEFINALHATAKGEKFFCGKVIDAIITKKFPKKENCAPSGISEREIEIIQQVAQGVKNKQIAQNLHLSIHTVNTHRKNIMRKLHIKSTTELVLYAIKLGIISTNQ